MRKWELAVGLALALSQGSCGRLNLKVGDNEPGQTGVLLPAPSPSLGLSKRLDDRSFRTPTDYIAHLEAIKAEGGANFFALYQANGRNFLRQSLRDFRDSILNVRTPEIEGKPSAFKQNNCYSIKIDEIFDVSLYGGDIRQLLDMVFLVPLNREQAKSMHPELPEQVSRLAKLVFFELGVNMNGVSQYAESARDGISTSTASVVWKIVHEKSDDEAMLAADDNAVLFQFEHSVSALGKNLFKLDATVSNSLQGFSRELALPSLSIHFISKGAPRSVREQALVLIHGKRFLGGGWQDLTRKRTLSLRPLAHDGLRLSYSESEQRGRAAPSVQNLEYHPAREEMCLIAGTEAP